MDKNGKLTDILVEAYGSSNIYVWVDNIKANKLADILALPGILSFEEVGTSGKEWSGWIDKRYDLEFMRKKIEEILSENTLQEEALHRYYLFAKQAASEKLKDGWTLGFDVNQDGGVIFLTLKNPGNDESHVTARKISSIVDLYSKSFLSLLEEYARRDFREIAERFSRTTPTTDELSQFEIYKAAVEGIFSEFKGGDGYNIQWSLDLETFTYTISFGSENLFPVTRTRKYSSISEFDSEGILSIAKGDIHTQLIAMVHAGINDVFG